MNNKKLGLAALIVAMGMASCGNGNADANAPENDTMVVLRAERAINSKVLLLGNRRGQIERMSQPFGEENFFAQENDTVVVNRKKGEIVENLTLKRHLDRFAKQRIR